MLGFALFLLLGLLLAELLAVWMTVRRLRRPPRRSAAWAVSRNQPTDPSEMVPARRFENYTLRLDPRRPREESPVWDITGDANSPDSPVVILTPGWGDSRVTMLGRAAALAPFAARVIVWDPPGHGESPAGSRCALGTREPAMIRALIEHAAATHARLIILYGFSLGAGASIVAAAERAASLSSPQPSGTGVPPVAPQPSSSLFSPPSSPKPQAPTPIHAVIAEAPYRQPWTPARNVLRLAGLPERTVVPTVFALLGARFGAGPRWRGAHAGVGFDRAIHAARVDAPLLVIHGGSDEICPAEDGEAIAAAAPRGTFARIEGATHNEMWRDAATANRATETIDRFLRQIAPARIEGADARGASAIPVPSAHTPH